MHVMIPLFLGTSFSQILRQFVPATNFFLPKVVARCLFHLLNAFTAFIVNLCLFVLEFCPGNPDDRNSQNCKN